MGSNKLPHKNSNIFALQIIPEYTAKTTLKMYSKANDWGEPISDKQLEIFTHTQNTNSYKTKEECIDTAVLDIDGDGLGFSIANEKIFFYDAGEFKQYAINADGSIKEETPLPVDSNCDKVSSLKDTSLQKPSNFGTPIKCTDSYENVGAISAPSTSVAGSRNHGAIAFYHRSSERIPWQLRGEIYGDTDQTELGEYAIEFEDEHDLKVVSNNYHINYVSDVLVSSYCEGILFHNFILYSRNLQIHRTNVLFMQRRMVQIAIVMTDISLLTMMNL